VSAIGTPSRGAAAGAKLGGKVGGIAGPTGCAVGAGVCAATGYLASRVRDRLESVPTPFCGWADGSSRAI